MNLNFETQTNHKSFTDYVFSVGILPNMIAAAAVFIYATGFITLPMDAMLPAIAIVTVIVFVAQAIFAPATHKLITQGLSDRIEYWKTSGLNEEKRTKLLKDILAYPRKKCIETYIHFFICAIELAFAIKFALHIDNFVMMIFFFVLSIASYISMVTSLYNTDTICSSIAVKLVEQGINQNEIKKHKYFGTPLSVSFILYIVVPIILSGAFTTLVTILGHRPVIIHPNGMIATLRLSEAELAGHFVWGTPARHTQIFRICYSCAANIILITFLSIMYFKRITSYSKQMNKAFNVINSSNLKDAPLFPVDLATEFSYTLHLANKTIVYFRNMIQCTSNVNRQIIQTAADLSSIARETESTAITQSTSVEEILATMVNTKNLASSTELKISEVINVAHKTMDDVNENFDRINENLEKMKEITEANKNTITGIQILSNKITSVRDIVTLINSVAEQTKIIAFNAELEASNIETGENNFHNVATEIRNLANKTMELTDEVSKQIQEIQDSSTLLIQTGQMCMDKISEGNSLTDELQKKFQSIKLSALATSEDAEKILSALQEQSAAFSEIVTALSDINNGVHELSGSAKTVITTVETLQTSSQHLENLGEHFSNIKTSSITEREGDEK